MMPAPAPIVPQAPPEPMPRWAKWLLRFLGVLVGTPVVALVAFACVGPWALLIAGVWFLFCIMPVSCWEDNHKHCRCCRCDCDDGW